MIKILLTDGIDAEGMSALSQNPNFQLTFVNGHAELLKKLPEAEALLVRSQTKVNAELLAQSTRLKLVGRAGVGVDNIDVNLASRKGIVVVNVPAGNTISAAEHTFALLLALARNIPQADASLRKGEWKREKYVGSELSGKILGLLGFGRIGREVAKRALSFGMKVFAFDPYVSEEHMKSFGVHSVSFENVVSQSDYLSLHLPVTEQTKKIINKQTLSQMKPEARLINCARGELVDETALIEALKSGKIRGAALDVFESEPPKNLGLFELSNLIATPHLGASTEEAQVKVAEDLAISVRDFFEKGLIRNAVNLPQVDAEILEKSSVTLALSEKMGRFVSQIVSGGIRKIKLEFAGDFAPTVRNLLVHAAVKGVLTTALGEKEVHPHTNRQESPWENQPVGVGINLVSSIPLARERGIQIEESAVLGSRDFTALITITVETDKEEKTVAGTVLSYKNPRIVSIDGLSVDVIPEGHLVVLTNIDRPGVVGFIGTVFGEHKINIAEFQVGRKSIGGEAVSILHVDSAVPPELLKKIEKFPGITKVWLVNLT